MQLSDYLKKLSVEGKADFAKRCKTSPDYLAQIGYGLRTPKVELAIDIDRESGGEVTCQELLPKVDWSYLRSKMRKKAAA